MSYTKHKADKYGNVVLDGRHRYSTDPAYANCRLIVGAGAFDVDIYDREGAHIVTHERGWGDKPTESIEPVSQLALLCRKPGSMDRATASILAASEANGRGAVDYDEPVDMAAYDDVFATMGGSRA